MHIHTHMNRTDTWGAHPKLPRAVIMGEVATGKYSAPSSVTSVSPAASPPHASTPTLTSKVYALPLLPNHTYFIRKFGGRFGMSPA
jgi:hypothetical protein